MNITLFVSPMCDNCIVAEAALNQLAESYNLSIRTYWVNRDGQTGNLVAYDENHNRVYCPDLPGVPALLSKNRLLVGRDCCEALQQELRLVNVSADLYLE